MLTNKLIGIGIIAALICFLAFGVYYYRNQTKVLGLQIAALTTELTQTKESLKMCNDNLEDNRILDKQRQQIRVQTLPIREKIESITIPVNKGENKDGFYKEAISLGNSLFGCFYDDKLCSKASDNTSR